MKFYLETPTLKRKEDALNYLKEHQEYDSDINGTGGMDECLDELTYENWLEIQDKMTNENYAESINRCPGKTYFLIRKEDNKIIGMINIRYNLTEAMLHFGGHIGYGIRPAERRKGYNKINLYLGLIKAKEEFNLDKVMLDCSVDNIGSNKTIKALGGILERCEIDPDDNTLTNVYWINTESSIKKYNHIYSKHI